MKISILGAGAWGTALAVSLARQHFITLWARDARLIEQLSQSRINQKYLPDIHLSDTITLTPHIDQALMDSNMIIIATPIAGLRPTLHAIRAFSLKVPIIWLCKGFEANTGKLAHEILQEEIPCPIPFAALSGPSFSAEVARLMPTAMVLASPNIDHAISIANQLHLPPLRIYHSTDIIGVELGGALKNIIAIATGICDGMSLGLNARAALLTRGLSEISRLALTMGAQTQTMMGLAGMGDLILTCTGDLSRNRTVGLQLAKNIPLETILNNLGHVAEGVYASYEVVKLAQKFKVDMPICHAVHNLLTQQSHIDLNQLVENLLKRSSKDEFS